MKLKVEGHAGLVKDIKTGAVLNTNIAELEGARKRKINKRKHEEEKELLKQDLANLQSEMAELKTLLKQMVGKDGTD